MTPKTYQINLNSLIGYTAMWAVNQSPYIVPEKLEYVLKVFHEALRDIFDEGVPQYRLKTMTRDALHELVKKHLLGIKEVQKWNEPKSKHKRNIFVSRFSTNKPDDDFIDLDALVRNITLDVLRDICSVEQENILGWYDL